VAILPLDRPFLSKAVRGQQEYMVYMEIQRLLKNEFQPQHEQLKEAYQAFVLQDSESLSVLARAIHRQLLKEALYDTGENTISVVMFAGALVWMHAAWFVPFP
jgi:hypothetical protein